LQIVIAKKYLALRSGRLHLREVGARTAAPPLYCFHATAYSGRTFEPLMQALTKRRVVAPDTPGYGESDPPEEIGPVPLERYAAVLGEAVVANDERPVDLFGYHTGAFLATELAVQRPDLVRKIVLVGAPFFEGEDRAERLASLGKPEALEEGLDQFEERWSFFITNRAPGVPLAQGFAHFVDHLKAYPNAWWSHDAAFRYAAERRLPDVRHPTLVLNPHNHLAEASRRAAAQMPNATVVELPHLGNAVLDLAAPTLAAHIETFLSA